MWHVGIKPFPQFWHFSSCAISTPPFPLFYHGGVGSVLFDAYDQRIIHVRHNAILGKGETSIHDTLKTDAGRRDIPLTEELEVWLAKYKKRGHSKFVLAMQNGRPLTQSAYKSMWHLVKRELPETHVTAHVLRHTYVTRLFEAGLDIKEIQYLAGHSTVDMALRVYTHPLRPALP